MCINDLEPLDRLASQPDDRRAQVALVGCQFLELIDELPLEPVALMAPRKQREVIVLAFPENLPAAT